MQNSLPSGSRSTVQTSSGPRLRSSTTDPPSSETRFTAAFMSSESRSPSYTLPPVATHGVRSHPSALPQHPQSPHLRSLRSTPLSASALCSSTSVLSWTDIFIEQLDPDIIIEHLQHSSAGLTPDSPPNIVGVAFVVLTGRVQCRFGGHIWSDRAEDRPWAMSMWVYSAYARR